MNSKDKNRSSITFMIVPHGGNKVVSIPLSSRLITWLRAGLLVAAIAAGYAVVTYIQMHQQNNQLLAENREIEQQYSALQQELTAERSELSAIAEQVNEMRSYLDQLESLETEIRNKTGSLTLPTSDKQEASTVSSILLNSGGPEKWTNLDPVVPAGSEEAQQIITRTSQLLSQLEKEVPDKVTAVNNLLKDVDELNQKLAHTPTIYPAVGVITSRYGYRRDPFHGARRFHDGFDIANRYRSPIYATADGTVVFSGRKAGHGNMVQIKHSSTIQTSYSHLAKSLVNVGDTVKKGQVIGEMGSTGRSTGVHVHYMVYKQGVPVDPEEYLPYE
ncbi:M23 family metallopeptidase [Brevibacillus humidisoli]|uniref:M23 family metallopeptidase n=1 Tax=Brevibacillus humidisoli TaxID=2895522 RepID=UPI001E4D12F3|nr:M23 family metallopeptidase [Brevibacillus humidisoli]UFJ41488.1 M23 family metallopeptidase [Brevibacillus humidisoli]